MKIIYGGMATHKRRCSGSNWTNNKRCEKEVAFRKGIRVGEVVNDFVGLDVKIYCSTHRHQAKKDGQNNEHIKDMD